MAPETETNTAVLDPPSTVADLPQEITAELANEPALEELMEAEIPEALKQPVEPRDLSHRELDDTDFWRAIPAYAELSRDEFYDHRFQTRNSVTSVDQLEHLVGDLVPKGFLDDARRGMRRAPMSMRVSPYILSLVDWSDPQPDPLRIQFVPVASSQLPDHPRLTLDSLHEQADSPTPGLVHRYPDKVLFLPLDVCPVYCRFCTRSYAIGGDTGSVSKVDFKPNVKRWEQAFAYLASRPEIEDVVVSGGDAYMLPAVHLRKIGEMLLAIPHIRRIRFASKGPAIMPTKILTDTAWTDTLVEMSEEGRRRGKEVCLHTHFNSANEITAVSQQAMNELFTRGVTVRNQSVLIRGVNDSPEQMVALIKQLSYINVQPYYVYQHDMVKHVEELRTAIGATVELERHVRGVTAGFNTPVFVTDLPGGGGKRDVHSYDHYNPVTGISVYRSPSVDEEKVYLYFDPIDRLPAEGRRRWEDPAEHGAMVREAVAASGYSELQLTGAGGPLADRSPAA